MVNKYIIIVAGGKGLRMGADVPKQFLLLKGKPVLMHTIEAFYNYDNTINILLVLPKEHFNYWNELCEKHNFNIKCTLVDGGSERFYSVYNALEKVPNDAIVGIHDGVRPLVNSATIDAAYKTAQQFGSAVPVIDSVDSLRHVSPQLSTVNCQLSTSNKSVDRREYKKVQTPQVFNSTKLKNAYSQEYSPLFTDDASVYESTEGDIVLTQGNDENIKITCQFDLKIAELII